MATIDILDTNQIKQYKRKKNEEYMSEEMRQYFKENLLKWKLRLVEEIDKTRQLIQTETGSLPDPGDQATREEEFNFALRSRDRERKLIKKIDSALKSIDENEYGLCEACGLEIGVGRLEARPTATLCVDCKTLEEIREKQQGG